jgi:hypothetical protein
MTLAVGATELTAREPLPRLGCSPSAWVPHLEKRPDAGL